MRTPTLLGILVVIHAAHHASTTALADDFRVETEVYQGKNRVGQALTLFSGGLVYDYLRDGKRDIATTVFDARRNRFILLNHKRKIRTEITTDQLMRVLDWLSQQVYAPEDQEFGVEYDGSKKMLKVSGRKLVYEAAGLVPKQKDAIQKYRDFADWYARLNATHGSNPPPFARIRLNDGLAKHGLIPMQIRRTLKVKGTDHVVRSKHTTLWTLSKSDSDRIRTTGTRMVDYATVAPDAFWKADKPVASK